MGQELYSGWADFEIWEVTFKSITAQHIHKIPIQKESVISEA